MAYDTWEAARLISWSNRQAGLGPLTEAELTRWIDNGVGLLEWAFTYEEDGEVTKYIDFPTLISLRLICLLHFKGAGLPGFPLKDITAATLRLREELGVHWPFASKEMWKIIPAASDKTQETRNLSETGKTEYHSLLKKRRYPGGNASLEFGEDEIASAWLPFKDIKIDPRFVSGSPCLAGTRIPTWIFPGMVKGGDSIEELADDYEIGIERVENALEWERQLASAGT